MSKFNKFDLVIAGHFHTKGEYGNITYVGTPYQMSWGDYGEDKGFHILNEAKLSFHKTNHELFYRFTYDEEQNMDYVFDLALKDKYIKVIVENRTDFKAYDKFITKLENKSPQDLKIIEPLMDLTSEDSLVQFDGELLVKDTEELIKDYIDDLYPEKRDKLSRLLLGLHSEARTL
jgi:DNA repair exonuclease SbcCD nuclease subunit